MSPLHITSRDATTGPVLEVIGELDHANADQLRELLTALTLQPGQRLVLDLAGVAFCDSSGITALIAARNRAQDAHAAVALAAVPASTLRVAGLDLVFPLYTDSEAATRP